MTRRLAVIAALLACFVSVRAEAAPPRTQVYVQAGPQSLRFTGDVGRFASSGIGVHALQGVQAGWLGAYLAIGTDYYLTNQPPPPYTRGLQTFSVSAGARVALPLEVVRPFIGLEYTSLGVSSNALTRYTGSRLHFNGVGARLAARLEALQPVIFEAGLVTRAFPAMGSGTAQWGFTISIGLAGLL